MLLKSEPVKLLLLNSLGRLQERLDIKVYAFVIMDNHAHFLIQMKGNISVMMQKFLLSFGRKYRHERPYVGHFWQGRFQSTSVTTDLGMREVVGYVHENPVKAKIVKESKEYPYSSAYAYFGFSNKIISDIIKITRYGDTSAGSCELIKG